MAKPFLGSIIYYRSIPSSKKRQNFLLMAPTLKPAAGYSYGDITMETTSVLKSSMA